MSRVIFPEWTESLKKWVARIVLGAPLYLGLLIYLGVSPEALRLGYQPNQPVPYSHALHAGELGMDCRYCHTTVERSAEAAVPPAATCMNCHTTIRPTSEKLLPIRQAYAENTSVAWTRVHDLPDYVYFDHSIHVGNGRGWGIGCETCHGRVDQMVKVFQNAPLTMGWCLDCHRNPTPNMRPARAITTMGFKRSEITDAERASFPKTTADGKPFVAPTNCSTCHR